MNTNPTESPSLPDAVPPSADPLGLEAESFTLAELGLLVLRTAEQARRLDPEERA